jgi:hypothetical protein
MIADIALLLFHQLVDDVTATKAPRGQPVLCSKNSFIHFNLVLRRPVKVLHHRTKGRLLNTSSDDQEARDYLRALDDYWEGSCRWWNDEFTDTCLLKYTLKDFYKI